MALKRCTSSKHLWNRKLTSLASPVPVLLEIIIIITVDIYKEQDCLKATQTEMQQ